MSPARKMANLGGFKIYFCKYHIQEKQNNEYRRT